MSNAAGPSLPPITPSPIDENDPMWSRPMGRYVVKLIGDATSDKAMEAAVARRDQAMVDKIHVDRRKVLCLVYSLARILLLVWHGKVVFNATLATKLWGDDGAEFCERLKPKALGFADGEGPAASKDKFLYVNTGRDEPESDPTAPCFTPTRWPSTSMPMGTASMASPVGPLCESEGSLTSMQPRSSPRSTSLTERAGATSNESTSSSEAERNTIDTDMHQFWSSRGVRATRHRVGLARCATRVAPGILDGVITPLPCERGQLMQLTALHQVRHADSRKRVSDGKHASATLCTSHTQTRTGNRYSRVTALEHRVCAIGRVARAAKVRLGGQLARSSSSTPPDERLYQQQRRVQLSSSFPTSQAHAMTIALYAHAPHAILPFLRQDLPDTVVAVGSIMCNRTSEDEAGPVEGLPVPGVLSTIHATFPPAQAGEALNPGDTWVIAYALPRPSEQIRVYHSLQHYPAHQTPDTIARAGAEINAVIDEMAKLYPNQRVVGQVPEVFRPAVQAHVGGPDHGRNWTYFAPASGTKVDLTGVNTEGLELGLAREDDAALVSGPKDPASASPLTLPQIFAENKYRSLEYYASRAAHTTVLRPTATQDNPTPLPVAWFMTHGDGSVGALHTMPDYRRRGLAKVLIAKHLGDLEARGVPVYCNVENGNEISAKLWEGLGWTRGWNATWIYEYQHGARKW